MSCVAVIGSAQVDASEKDPGGESVQKKRRAGLSAEDLHYDAMEYFGKKKFDTAAKLFVQRLKLLGKDAKAGDLSSTAMTFFKAGMESKQREPFVESAKYWKEHANHVDDDGTAKSLGKAAIAYFNAAIYSVETEDKLKFLLESVELFADVNKDLKNPTKNQYKRSALANFEVACAYKKLNNLSKAKKSFLLARNLYEQAGDKGQSEKCLTQWLIIASKKTTN